MILDGMVKRRRDRRRFVVTRKQLRTCLHAERSPWWCCFIEDEQGLLALRGDRVAGQLVVGLRAAANQRRFPFTDDWNLVPFVTGDRPVTFSWLWAQHGDHRIPLVKALFLVIYNRVTTYDFRAAVMTISSCWQPWRRSSC